MSEAVSKGMKMKKHVKAETAMSGRNQYETVQVPGMNGVPCSAWVGDAYLVQQRNEHALRETEAQYAYREKIVDAGAIPVSLVIVVLIAAAVILHLVRKSIAANLEIAKHCGGCCRANDGREVSNA